VLADLGTLGGDSTITSWLNDAGEVVGGTTTAGEATFDATLWRDGSVTDLGTLEGDCGSFAHAVNSTGQIVGNRIPPGLRVAPEPSRASFGLPEICSFHPDLWTKKISHRGFIEDRRKNRPPLTWIDPEVASLFAFLRGIPSPIVNQLSLSCTTTTIRIQGWIQHSQRDTPNGSAAVPAVGPGSVLPASTN